MRKIRRQNREKSQPVGIISRIGAFLGKVKTSRIYLGTSAIMSIAVSGYKNIATVAPLIMIVLFLTGSPLYGKLINLIPGPRSSSKNTYKITCQNINQLMAYPDRNRWVECKVKNKGSEDWKVDSKDPIGVVISDKSGHLDRVGFKPKANDNLDSGSYPTWNVPATRFELTQNVSTDDEYDFFISIKSASKSTETVTKQTKPSGKVEIGLACISGKGCVPDNSIEISYEVDASPPDVKIALGNFNNGNPWFSYLKQVALENSECVFKFGNYGSLSQSKAYTNGLDYDLVTEMVNTLNTRFSMAKMPIVGSSEYRADWDNKIIAPDPQQSKFLTNDDLKCENSTDGEPKKTSAASNLAENLDAVVILKLER
jgi:hypothetical protein